jgi:hypothetical protein
VADDVNKHGKGVNGIPKPIEEAIADRNRRIDHSYLDNDDKYSSMVNGHSQVQDTIANLTKKLQGTSDPGQANKIISEIQESANLQQQLENRIDQYQLSNASQQNNSLGDRIKTYTNSRNVNQRTTTMAGEQRFMRMAHESQDLYAPTEVLEQRISQRSKELGNVGIDLSTRVRGIGEGDIPSNLMDKASRIQELQEDIALNKRMLKVQNKEGLSTEKRMYSAHETIEGVGGFLKQDQLRKDVKAGKYGDVESETSKLAEMFQKLTSATEKWESASENATDAQGNLTQEYKQASAELEKLQKDTEQQRKIVAEVGRQGGGGGGMNGGTLRQYAQFGSQIVGAGYGMDIDDKIMEMNLKARTGQTAVDQFSRVNAGTGGDMRSLLRESTSQEFIKNFSDSMRSKAMRQGAANTVATGVDAIGSGITAIGDFDATGATLGVAAGAMNAVRAGSQVFRGLPQTMKALEAYNAGENFSNVANEIPAYGLQKVYDQQMAAYGATSGLGGAAGGAESTLLDKHSLGNFAKVGLTPAQAASLTSMSAGALGSNEAATSVALRSGQIERTRMMSADQYIGMAGQLSQAGGGTADLEEIMKSAVSAGMDNAKNIQQMVSATVSLSGSMARMGMSGTTASGNLLASTVQGIGGDKNIAALAAESMINKRAAMDSSSDINLGNVFEHSELRKLDKQMSTPELMAMSKLTQQEYRQIIEGGRGAAYEFGLEKVYDRAGGANAFRKGAGIAGQATAINMGLGTYGGGEDLGKVGNGDTTGYSTEARALAFTSGTTYKSFGVHAGKDPNKVDNFVEQRSTAQDFQNANAAREVQGFSFGAGDDVNQTLKQIATTMQALLTQLTPDKAQGNVEGRMDDMKATGPIVKAGDSFKDAAKVFAKGVEDFNAILSKTDMGEHRVKHNMVDNSGSQRIKR